VGECGLGAHPVGVVPGAGQELSGDLDPDTEQGQQPGCDGGDQLLEFGVGGGDLRGQVLVAPRQPPQRDLGGCAGSRSGPGARSRAQVWTSTGVDKRRRSSRSSASPVSNSALSWLTV